MAKKKDTTALFEVISKTRESQAASGMSVPSWMQTGKQPPELPEAEPVVAKPKPTAPPKRPKPLGGGSEPIISTSGNRLNISLGQGACIAVAAGIVVLLAAMFLLGRLTAGDSSPTEGEAQKAGLNGNKPASPGNSYKPVPGKWYMLIQKLDSAATVDRNEAERFINFLAERNEGAWLFTKGNYAAIFSTATYDGREDPAAVDAAKVIDRYCRMYVQKYRTKYKYEQVYDSHGNPKPVLMQYAEE